MSLWDYSFGLAHQEQRHDASNGVSNIYGVLLWLFRLVGMICQWNWYLKHSWEFPFGWLK